MSDLLVDVKEENVDLENKNFDIEVFREDGEELKRLYFIKKPTFIKNDILLDEPEDANQQIILDPSYVEYWFNMVDVRTHFQTCPRLAAIETCARAGGSRFTCSCLSGGTAVLKLVDLCVHTY